MRDLQQSAPGRGSVPLGVSPSDASTDAIDHGRFLPGTVLAGRFRIVGMLGKGGMGEVRLARQVPHPNVCRVYDISQIDGELFLSMEYVDGEDLAQRLRRIGRFPADRAATLARQLCLGLHAAHEKGVLHRDLKPANIMIDGRGKLLLTDSFRGSFACNSAGSVPGLAGSVPGLAGSVPILFGTLRAWVFADWENGVFLIAWRGPVSPML